MNFSSAIDLLLSLKWSRSAGTVLEYFLELFFNLIDIIHNSTEIGLCSKKNQEKEAVVGLAKLI